MALIIEPGAGGRQPVAGSETPGDLIKDSDAVNFAADVIEASKQVPVIVDFWAPGCGPCKQLTPALEKLVKKGAGLVRLVKINVDENQDVAAQFRVQSVPTVYGFKDGQGVDGFMGALPESQLQAFIDRLTDGAKAPVDEALAVAEEALNEGSASTALGIFAQVLKQDTTNAKAAAGIIRSYMVGGQMDQARRIADELAQDLTSQPEVQAAITALVLAEESGAGGNVSELMDKVAMNPGDNQARFDLAVALYGVGETESAIDALMDLVRRDRAWNDEAARTQLVKIFEALGPTHPLTVAGRRKLSSVLFS